MGVTITRFAILEFNLSVIPVLYLSVIPAKAGIYFAMVLGVVRQCLDLIRAQVRARTL